MITAYATSCHWRTSVSYVEPLACPCIPVSETLPVQESCRRRRIPPPRHENVIVRITRHPLPFDFPDEQYMYNRFAAKLRYRRLRHNLDSEEPKTYDRNERFVDQ
jgi:hypothetical protein